VILDTNALSAVAEADAGAVAEFARAPTIAIPVIVLGEFWFGITQSRWRSKYENWVSATLQVCRILEISSETAGHYAEIRFELRKDGTPIPSNDVWIAALCRQHSLPLLSRDRHFDMVKAVRRIGW
jgi:predicted nucleic acid-binding protein